MRFSNGAGGFAAAMFLLLLGTFNPTPSRAWQVNLPAAVPAPAAPLAPIDAAPAPADAAGPAAQVQAQTVVEPAIATLPVMPAPAAKTIDKAEQECLATAVYFEAKGEPHRGQVAVAQVILNRTHSGRFPASVCGVVRQRGQFSFVHGGRLPAAPRASAQWHQAASVARDALDGSGERVASNALFFHARGVVAGWHAVRVAQIGNQVFYR